MLINFYKKKIIYQNNKHNTLNIYNNKYNKNNEKYNIYIFK